ncbi:MAG TPA: restriction endonuclease subunit S, partial [Candidatus Deferrimicrobium sp.]|nr:restriction endonuclease subunit S [Candidatus Deferrimicrobium sp.]
TAYIAEGKFWVNNHSHILDSLTSNSFLCHFLNQFNYTDFVTGSTRLKLTQTKLREIPLPLPPLNEQKRIAAKLDKIIPRIEAVKERLDKVPAIIKRFRQSVLTAAVTGKLTEKWRAEHPDVESAEALYKILQEKNTSKDKIYISKSLKSELFLPDIPSTWLWIKLPDSGEFGRGKSKHRPRNAKHLYGGIYPFIQTGDVAQSNGLILNHKQTYSTQGFAQSRLWPAGTICITIAANIADSAILTYPACFPDSIVGIIVNRDLYETNFIEYYIRTIKEDISLYAPATAQKNINLSILSELLVPLPPFEEQKEIVRQVDKLFAVADKLETHYKNAKAKVDKLSQSVLAKAFRGELVITEAELAEKEGRDFESAEELLNRIQKEKERLSQDTPRTRKKKREEHEKD